MCGDRDEPGITPRILPHVSGEVGMNTAKVIHVKRSKFDLAALQVSTSSLLYT